MYNEKIGEDVWILMRDGILKGVVLVPLSPEKDEYSIKVPNRCVTYHMTPENVFWSQNEADMAWILSE